MKRFHYTLFLVVILSSCSGEPVLSEEISFEYDDNSLNEKIRKALDISYLKTIGIEGDRADFLKSYYQNHRYKAVWVNDSSLTDLGERMKHTLECPEQLGVPPKRHTRPETFNFLHDEFLNTLMIAEIAPDLKEGVIDFEENKKKSMKRASSSDMDTILMFNTDSDLRLQFLRFGPRDTSYHVLGKGLVQLMDTYPMDTTTFDVASVKNDSVQNMKKAINALMSKGYLTVENDTAALIAALKEFQKQNGLKVDGVVGKYTSKALNESTVHRRNRIILAMDKIRAREPRPERYICINIPEYKLRFYINDSLKSDHNIVIGTYENQTPELTSKLRKIIAYPYWNVPYSISSKEILPAQRSNSGYLERHNYTIYRNGEKVDPSTVDWSKIRQTSFPFKVVQDPGRTNSLGIIKFDFPNSHSVYFHDTPSKALFRTDVRAYSHGCIRTQHPLDLAKAIIERDSDRKEDVETALDSLDSIMQRGQNREIKLKKQIPIFIEYVTAVRRGEEIITYIDIYGRDDAFLSIMQE